jgi:hypothetical protein
MRMMAVGAGRSLAGVSTRQPTPAAGDVGEWIAARYRHFAELEAPGRSPLYVRIATAVAADRYAIEFLARLPPAKWQPNLLFGTVRYLYGTAAGPDEFLELLRAHGDEIAALMSVRATQTNEPARCATLLPVLARLPPPLALLEVGASAGLCLLPDCYAYDYGPAGTISPARAVGTEPPVFRCRAGPATPVPDRNVEVSWRAGLDLHPVDLHRDADVRWLEALVWPGEEYRIPTLRAACAIARADPPGVVVGDLRTDLPALAAQAPADATLVVFHTAVLGYLDDPGERAALGRLVAGLGAVWISNEPPGVVAGVPEEVLRERPPGDDFLLCVDGRATAWTDGHGTWIDWR